MGQRTYICEDCGAETERTGISGPIPKRCPDCSRRRRTNQARGYRASKLDRMGRYWLEQMFCLDCGAEIPPRPDRQRRPYRCDVCRPEHRKPYRTDRDKQRNKHLRSTYGISLDDFEAMRERQDGRCAICGVLPDVLHVDHDHATNAVRDLLCGSCNRMIGLAKEDPAVLRAAVEYLQRHANDPRHSTGARPDP